MGSTAGVGKKEEVVFGSGEKCGVFGGRRWGKDGVCGMMKGRTRGMIRDGYTGMRISCTQEDQTFYNQGELGDDEKVVCACPLRNFMGAKKLRGWELVE